MRSGSWLGVLVLAGVALPSAGCGGGGGGGNPGGAPNLQNGKDIFVTGFDAQGTDVLDLAASTMKMQMGCGSCHGSDGRGMTMPMMSTPSIRWADLSSATLHSPPYDQPLFFRFLDTEEKSNGAPAQTGVVWKMP